MGVPKFYRWISERYPCLSETVKEFQLPEFDNLYLDMNGIIHVCSHPDDENPHFRITEEKIFKDICHYIDFLFRMIKPRKVFFMAVDGVAPRAKMNQQRSRRFRSAREAETLIEKAVEKGEVLPTEKRFDSNCITPGTPFMVRLQDHLKYFVVDKITHDPLWQGPKVYLSGHETPGEGEHKVMDYIRYSKSQPDHDPDTRHCLYGLDADLIMLGLTSHEPHFSLLREEVRFGGKKDRNKRPATPEETTFHLLHLSLLRDYLAYEFSELKDKLPFAWDLENILDDWILMGFLVGNDFIPHLPHLHIHHDALPLLWKTYVKVLPTLDGYLNEGGHLNLPRLEKYFEELSKYDEETFESAFSDLSYLESKLGGKSINESVGQPRKNGKMRKLKPFEMETNGVTLEELEPPVNTSIGDEDEDCNTFDAEFKLHKRNYYMSKMAYQEVTPAVLTDQAQGYVVALQWILLYYFEGCPSWSWFYPHHYAPYISDVRGFKDMEIQFELSTPFLPFQQLMAVLPAASKELLPPSFQTLMTEASSPVIEFYPVQFDTDLNGKQQDWEAVVLIPFIDEVKLLSAMQSREHLLTKEESARNTHGPHHLFQYSNGDNFGFYPSSLPGVFPDIPCSKAERIELHKDLFRIDVNKLRKGLLEGCRAEVYFPGFPRLQFLPHTHELKKAGVKVFQHNSRGENTVLHIQSTPNLRLEDVVAEVLGKTTYVGWPHMHEARVVAVANEATKIELIEEVLKKGEKPAVSFNRRSLDEIEADVVHRDATFIKERQMERFAIDVGNTEIVLYACPLTGRTYTYGNAGAITLEKQFSCKPIPFVYQMTVKDLQVEESGHTTFQTLDQVFPENSVVFMRGSPHYGAQGTVRETVLSEGRVRISLAVKQEPDFQMISNMEKNSGYYPSHVAAQYANVDPYLISRITGAMFVEKSSSASHPDGSGGGGAGGFSKANIGLNLKFTKRREEVPGYTHFVEELGGWQYTDRCVDLVKDYVFKFQDLWRRVRSLSKRGPDVYLESDLFPPESPYTMNDVVKYIQELPSSKTPKVKFGSQLLTEDQIKQIENMTAKLKTGVDTVKLKVKPRLLFRPLDNQGTLVPDPEADFELYDRVVVVKAGYSVPFGKRGTVVGVPSPEDEEAISAHSMYDVVFDEEFAGGITLRCSPNKGYRVPGSAMLNITYGEFRKDRPKSELMKANKKTSIQNRFASTDKSPLKGFNNNNSGRGPTGRPSRGGNPTDRAGPYPDRAAMWQQQQQQHPFAWDKKRQPTFGQVFTASGSVQPFTQFGQDSQGRAAGGGSQLKFITPKVTTGPQANVPVTSSSSPPSHGLTVAKDSVEFEKMWKQLQTHQKHKDPPSSSAHPSVSLPPSLASLPPPDLPRSMGPLERRESSTSPQVQKFFDSVAQSGQTTGAGPAASSEGDQFLALFNSLKLQTKEAKNTRKSPEPAAPLSQADQALKQLLKIGVGLGGAGHSTDTGPATTTFDSANQGLLPTPADASSSTSSPAVEAPSTSEPAPEQAVAPQYGRQVSLQALFQEEVDRQQKAQQQQQQQMPSQSGQTQVVENRDPRLELEHYCKTVFAQGSPMYDFKHQLKLMTYISVVVLPSGQRFEGSQCRTKEDAAKSAASMALLCLKSKQQKMGGQFPPGFASPGVRPGVNRFFSTNSAFSPIGLTGPNPGLLPRHPPPPSLLLTPQHFVNQPPPSHHHHRMFHQPPPPRHQQQHPQQQAAFPSHMAFGGQDPRQPQTRGPPPPHLMSQQLTPAQLGQGGQPKSTSGATTVTTSAVSSSSQQFIPMQVTRKQKNPSSKKKEEPVKLPLAGSDTQQTANTTKDTPPEKSRDKPSDLPHSSSAPVTEWRTAEREQTVSSSLEAGQSVNGSVAMTTPSQKAASSSSSSPSVPKSAGSRGGGQKKKKSRLAANFAKK